MPIPKSLIDDAGEAVRSVIRAFHASPYDFDRFDASKIGAGEGAQAFGHGLYFAQSPSVMEEYYKQFKKLRPSTRGEWSAATVRNAEEQLRGAGSADEAISQLESLLEGGARDDLSLRPKIDEAIAYLRNQKPPRATRYEVEIEHPESSLLDWDAPIAGQSKPVQGLAGRLGVDSGTGGDLYWRLGSFSPNERPGWGSVLNTINDKVTRPFDASAQLMESGIPGVRYLDQNSRAVGAGTRNYVMFPGTEDSIRILRKYGLLAPMAAGASVAPDQQ